MTKKILMLIPQLGFGGAEKSFIRLANFLSKYHNVTIALFDKSFNGYSGDNLAAPLNDEIQINYLGSQGNLLNRWFKRWKSFRKLKKQSDVSISFLSGTNFLNVLSGTHAYTIISERGSKKLDVNLKGFKRFLLLKIIDPITYRLTNKIVTVSEGLSLEILENRDEVLKDKVIAIEGYIDSKKLIELSEEHISDKFKILKKYLTIVAVGRLSKEKGFKELINAFAKIKKKMPNVKLLIVGSGPQEKELYNLATNHLKLRISVNQSNIENSDVIFAGFKNNPSKYYQLGKVIAFSSITEGLPNVLIEAIASGIPILAADCSLGVRSVMGIDKGTKHLLVPFDNSIGTLMPMINTINGSKIWIKYLLKYINQPSYRSKPENRLVLIQRFDLNQTGKYWLKIIQDKESI